jgi:hypothetical protein
MALPFSDGQRTGKSCAIPTAQAYRLNLGVILKHDLVFVVDIAELLFSNIDASTGDVEGLPCGYG